MKNTLKNLLRSSLFPLLFFNALGVRAVDFPTFQPPGTGGAPVTQVSDVLSLIVGWVELFQIIFWIAAAAFGLYTAFMYLTAGGDPTKLGKAKTMLIYTIVAAALGLLAFGIPALINNFFTVRA